MHTNRDKKFFKKHLKKTKIFEEIWVLEIFNELYSFTRTDTVLINRNLNQFISGYAHLYSYDYKMLSKILAVAGFKTRKATFNDSKIKEMQEPLHVIGLEKMAEFQ